MKYLKEKIWFSRISLDETGNYFIGEIDQNKLISKKYKKVSATFSYIEHLLNLASTVTECTSISAFAFSAGVSTGITSSSKVLNNCVITAGIKRYKPIFTKKKKKH